MKVSQPNPILDFIAPNGSSGNLTFVIPVYQRNYSWDKEDCDQLFEDVVNSIESGTSYDPFHYFGNIVYDESTHDPFSGYAEYILIDGQQRITSTMLLLAAIRDEEPDKTKRDGIDGTYLKNKDAEEEHKIKLKQIEMDRESYIKIVNRDIKEIDNNSQIYKNYMRFRSLIRSYKEESGATSEDLLKGLRSLNVIAINLQSRLPGAESPQMIFESINATGKPLSNADLLRNFLLFEIGIEKQEKYYNEYWLKIEQRIGNANVSDFLRRYLVLRLHRDIKSGTEYKTFKKNYVSLFTDAESAMAELVKYSTYYQWIKQPESLKESPKTASLLREADLLRLIPAIPVFMWLLEKVQSNVIEFDEFNKVLKVIMDWSFRARVTNIITTGEIGEILTTKILELLESKPEDDMTYSDYLRFELSNYRVRDIYATDNQFKEAFIKYNFYKNYGRYVQEKLAQSSSNDKHLLFESIEHILPQTLDQSKWPDITVSEHAEWVNTIGNLVPMNQPDNSENQNDDIDTKTKNLTISDWLLTREAVQYKIDGKWTVKSIENRARDLSNKAIGIWSGPLERTRDIEAPSSKKSKENMIKLMNMVDGFALPNIIPAPKQERNAVYYSFHTKTLNEIYGSEDGFDCYTYAIVMEDGVRWDHVNLTIRRDKEATNKEQRDRVDECFISISDNTPKQDWQFFKVARWNNNSEDESGDEEALQEILSERIPEFERHLKESLAE